MSAQINITRHRGDSHNEDFTIQTTIGGVTTAYNLTGCAVKFTVRPYLDAAAVITKTTANSGELEILVAANGTIRVKFTDAEMQALSVLKYHYDIEVTLVGGKTATAIYGLFTILPDYTA